MSGWGWIARSVAGLWPCRVHGRLLHTIGDVGCAWFGRNPSGGRIVTTIPRWAKLPQQIKYNNQLTLNNEWWTINDERWTMNIKISRKNKRRMNDRTNVDEMVHNNQPNKRTTNNEQRTTNNKRRTTNNKRWTKSDKQATNDGWTNDEWTNDEQRRNERRTGLTV